MVTIPAFRAMALSLPEAEEREHMGHPDFRVRDKIFASLQPSMRLVSLKVDKELQAGLIEAEPTKFTRVWGNTAWTGVHLDHIEPGELRALIVGSWRLVAPKRLAATLDAT